MMRRSVGDFFSPLYKDTYVEDFSYFNFWISRESAVTTIPKEELD